MSRFRWVQKLAGGLTPAAMLAVPALALALLGPGAWQAVAATVSADPLAVTAPDSPSAAGRSAVAPEGLVLRDWAFTAHDRDRDDFDFDFHFRGGRGFNFNFHFHGPRGNRNDLLALHQLGEKLELASHQLQEIIDAIKAGNTSRQDRRLLQLHQACERALLSFHQQFERITNSASTFTGADSAACPPAP